MFRILVLLKANNGKDVPFIRDCLRDISRITLAEEPCCKRLDVYHSQSDEQVFILCEEWDARQDWEGHRNERAFREIYAPKVLPLVEREPHISILVNEPE